MAITIFGGEAQRKSEATNTFAKKYPITSDVSAIQDNINKANVELVGLRNDQPKTAGGAETPGRCQTPDPSHVDHAPTSLPPSRARHRVMASSLALTIFIYLTRDTRRDPVRYRRTNTYRTYSTY